MDFRDFEFYMFQNMDLIRLLESSPQWRTLADDELRVDRDANAYLLGFLRRYDRSFLKYGYQLDGVEYGFAWRTEGDAMHQALSGAEPEWHDRVGVGDSFGLRVQSSQPEVHWVSDPVFAPMNHGRVLFLGARQIAIGS